MPGSIKGEKLNEETQDRVAQKSAKSTEIQNMNHCMGKSQPYSIRVYAVNFSKNPRKLAGSRL